MGFYSEWNKRNNDGLNTDEYILRFIESNDEDVNLQNIKENEEIVAAYKVLYQIPLPLFFDSLKKVNEFPILTPQDIPCFSSLENGASRLNELLSFSNNGLSFTEIGYQLMNSVTASAQRKYGENQSKLAAMMGLVHISNSRPNIVTATPWGNYLTSYTFNEKKDVLKKALLRDPCIKAILCRALNNTVQYAKIVSFLKPSTMIRRRTNVKLLINFILKDSEQEITLSKIDWEV